MQDLPSGTVTFLFTDIEGSTKRWEAHPQVMKAALERHDAILRQAIESQGGVVFRREGDAFRVVFLNAPPGVSAAVQAQRTIAAEPWPQEIAPLRVRMALHTGAAEVREGDYVGQSLNRVARIISAAHGGQTLLSLTTTELVRDSLPGDVGLGDMGEHRLKDLIRPEHIYQLVVSGLPSDFPPLLTLDLHPNNLPLQPTPLIGRESELTEVEKLLSADAVRLVTLTGPGGTGKTRLALQAGADLVGSDKYVDGVWFVDLAPIGDPNLVISTIAQTLGVRENLGEGEPLFTTLANYLSNKHLLLVLDNFEQVVDAGPQIARLKALSAGLKTLVTSRVSLRVSGEHEYPVPPLSVPDIRPGHLPELKKLTQFEAVKLFIERAQAVKPDFQVTNENAPAVAEICSRLDGLPLAIELAAARVKMLPPQALLARLASRLKILTGGARDLPARQQTLRGAIEWSYDLLDEGEKQLFRRMAVFNGGRTFEALETVCNYDGQLALDILNGVQSLIDKSLLLQREGADGEPRYWMLETIHEYAQEKMQESGEAQDIQGRHLLFFMQLAERAEPELMGPEQQQWYDRLEEEIDNIRGALRWTTESGRAGNAANAEKGLRLTVALRLFWTFRGYISEGKAYLVPLLDLVPRGTAIEAAGLSVAGYLAVRQGDIDAAQALLEKSLGMSRELGDKKGISRALVGLAIVTHDQAKEQALLEESLSIEKELGDKAGLYITLNNLGVAAFNRNEYERALSLYQECLAIAREMGHRQGIADSLFHLGELAVHRGEYNEALSLYREALVTYRVLRSKLRIAEAFEVMAVLAAKSSDRADATNADNEQSELRAAKLWAAAETLRKAIGAGLDPTWREFEISELTAAHARVEETAWRAAEVEGRAMTMEEAIAYALNEGAQ